MKMYVVGAKGQKWSKFAKIGEQNFVSIISPSEGGTPISIPDLAIGCWGGGGSQVIGAQTADAVLTLNSSKLENFTT